MDLSSGKIISSNPYTPLLRDAIGRQVDDQAAKGQLALHPVQLVASVGMHVGLIFEALRPGVQGGVRGWRWEGGEEEPTAPAYLSSLFAGLLKQAVLGLLFAPPPEEVVQDALDQVWQKTLNVQPDVGGATFWLIETSSNAIDPSPLAYLNVLVAVLVAASYCGVGRDALFEQHAALFGPPKSKLVMP